VGPGTAGLLWDALSFLQASPLVKHVLLVAFVILILKFHMSFKDNIMQKNDFNDQSTRQGGLLFRRPEWTKQMLSVSGHVDKLGRGQRRATRTITNLKNTVYSERLKEVGGLVRGKDL